MFNILVLYGTARKFTKFQNTRISLLFRSFVLFDLFLKQIHSTRLQIVNTVLEVLAARHLYFSKALAARCSPSVFSKVHAAREKNLTTARARKNKQNPRMLVKTARYP